MYFPEGMTFQYFFFDTYPGYFLQALPIALAAGAIFMPRRTGRTGEHLGVKSLAPALFVCYLTGLLCLTLFLDVMGELYYLLFYHTESGKHIHWFTWVFNLAPAFSFDAEQIGNFFMFLPFGILYPLFRPRSTWKRTVAAGIALCLGIEFLQPIFGRSFDINDVILDGLAVIVSAAVFHALKTARPARGE